MADRDPEEIMKEIDQARSQLAATVDSLADRANPQHIADQAKARAVAFARQPVVMISAGGVVLLFLALLIRRVRNR